jgi:hypothetical protein
MLENDSFILFSSAVGLLCSDRYTAEDEMQYPNSLLVAPLPPLRARHSSSFTAMIFSPLAYLCPSVSDLFLTPVHHV